jgi:hypothetical protein
MSNLPIYERLAQAFASEGKGFGLRGTNAPISASSPLCCATNEAQGAMEIWNIPISDQVVSPSMRRMKVKGHGVI